jgi:hypothetical protein
VPAACSRRRIFIGAKNAERRKMEEQHLLRLLAFFAAIKLGIRTSS